MRYFYADAENQVVGPISLELLKELREKTQISNSTLVIEEGASDWQACRDVVSPASLATLPPTIKKKRVLHFVLQREEQSKG